MEGKKKVEIRTSFSEKWEGTKVCVYASKPAQRLVGEATISAVEKGAHQEIWERFGGLTGVSMENYDAYSEGYFSVEKFWRPR